MKKKFIVITIIEICIIIILSGILIYLVFFKGNTNNVEEPSNSNVENVVDSNDNKIEIPKEGNNYVITTKSKTTLRIINEYDNSMFTKSKNLLIMFGSWCPNCQKEISEIEKIIKKYKNDKNVNVIIIAHEYEDTISDLISLVENQVDFGDIEIKVDLGRVIRKTIDPEASTVPISYVVNKKGKVLKVHNESITLEKAIELVK